MLSLNSDFKPNFCPCQLFLKKMIRIKEKRSKNEIDNEFKRRICMYRKDNPGIRNTLLRNIKISK
ncbi:hypothetical protein BpHYR1_017409 [Brachionus plicatilis]|uniref:Uncharacterized protein n=1 Tax=Brachionus plicatilis TaxID=10195 RepID=A0A3M7P766_BRAPC|nr:hypothetical protein BpHYR1_017409 [Brachionus plicatilis]